MEPTHTATPKDTELNEYEWRRIHEYILDHPNFKGPVMLHHVFGFTGGMEISRRLNG